MDQPVIGKRWKATPGTRMMELLHATDVPLGLVTNGPSVGRMDAGVCASRGALPASPLGMPRCALCIDEPVTLRAFHSLVSTRRIFDSLASHRRTHLWRY